MNRFDLDGRLDSVYSHYPEAGKKPVIVITGNFADGETRLADRYYKSVAAVGGVPVIMPPSDNCEVIINTLERADALLLSGGGDVNPLWTGEEPSPCLKSINKERDAAELLAVKLAYNRRMPVLGICRGMQVIAAALGGETDQDISEARAKRRTTATVATAVKHSQDADRNEPTHTVRIEKGSILSHLYNTRTLAVNSMHHQAVRNTGRRFNVTATAPDGVIEAMESNEYRPVIGVQWHPEWLEDSGPALFEWLVGEASTYHEAKNIHNRIITLDSHCDTPMFFHKDIRFDRRDDRILVDLHKMTEGKQDVVTMAAYLPQPKDGKSFAESVELNAGNPFDYANLIFDKIEEITETCNRYIAAAHTPAELYENKRNGKRSVMLAIENGLALDGDMANLEHFARRGVVYITLCHNGDNDICDSARGNATHNGVSAYGADVIREMNRLGIMVDMSHASEKSFYDALQISSKPPVCSHSNCKSLCNVPRNLTDDQLKALARKGGVCQITLYHGFLRNDTQEADIRDAVAHLEHAIDIMGIEHVGLGTDFDGDGGIRGLADSSEMLGFTSELLRRRYGEADIERIWGGNWMRVMAEVQDV